MFASATCIDDATHEQLSEVNKAPLVEAKHSEDSKADRTCLKSVLLSSYL